MTWHIKGTIHPNMKIQSSAGKTIQMNYETKLFMR